jgi:hypothetical protein
MAVITPITPFTSQGRGGDVGSTPEPWETGEVIRVIRTDS